MSQAAHEQFVAYRRVDPPSDRKFGLTVGGVLVILSAVRGWLGHAGTVTIVILCVGVVLLGAALIAPALLHPLNRTWMGIGEALGRVTNLIIMLILFAFIFTPLALVMRICRRDALCLRADPARHSYWHERNERSESGSLTDQF